MTISRHELDDTCDATLFLRDVTASKRTEHGEVRPLLVGGDPAEKMRRLLDAREPFYKLADFEVAAERGAEQVVAGDTDPFRAADELLDGGDAARLVVLTGLETDLRIVRTVGRAAIFASG